jgi:hypothetical protein
LKEIVGNLATWLFFSSFHANMLRNTGRDGF